MSWREYTIIIMGVTSCVLIIWDIIVALFNKVSYDTESEIIQSWFIKKGIWPLAYGWGILGGHLFMPGVFWTFPTWTSYSILILTIIMSLVLGLWLTPRISQKRWRVALRGFALLELGILAGWLLWPQ